MFFFFIVENLKHAFIFIFLLFFTFVWRWPLCCSGLTTVVSITTNNTTPTGWWFQRSNTPVDGCGARFPVNSKTQVLFLLTWRKTWRERPGVCVCIYVCNEKYPMIIDELRDCCVVRYEYRYSFPPASQCTLGGLKCLSTRNLKSKLMVGVLAVD